MGGTWTLLPFTMNRCLTPEGRVVYMQTFDTTWDPGVEATILDSSKNHAGTPSTLSFCSEVDEVVEETAASEIVVLLLLVGVCGLDSELLLLVLAVSLCSSSVLLDNNRASKL